MRGKTPRRVAVVCALAALVGTGCLLPRPADPIRFWVLSAPDTADAGTVGVRSVGIEPIELPAYLDRREIVTRTSENELSFSAFQLWGEPLERGFQRVLALSLIESVPDLRVVALPSNANASHRVSVRVSRFDADASGRVNLVAEWTLRARGSAEILAGGTAQLEEPSNGRDTADRVATLSRAVTSLADRIAPAILELPEG